MKTRKRFLAVLLSLFMIMTLLPVSVGAQDALTVTVTPTGSSQTVLTSDESITAETEDTALLTLEQTDANTVTAAAVSGAVGIAEVTVSNASGGTKTVQVPVGYTTFAFAGDTLTVYPGSSSAYEISGINVSDAAYTPTAETMADGSLVYTNTDEYSLCVEIKKSGGTFVFTGESDDMSIAERSDACILVYISCDSQEKLFQHCDDHRAGRFGQYAQRYGV